MSDVCRLRVGKEDEGPVTLDELAREGGVVPVRAVRVKDKRVEIRAGIASGSARGSCRRARGPRQRVTEVTDERSPPDASPAHPQLLTMLPARRACWRSSVGCVKTRLVRMSGLTDARLVATLCEWIRRSFLRGWSYGRPRVVCSLTPTVSLGSCLASPGLVASPGGHTEVMAVGDAALRPLGRVVRCSLVAGLGDSGGSRAIRCARPQ
jgi:hypothetical protein